MLTMLLYVLIVGLVAALLFLVASAVFGRGEELGPLPEGTTETVLPAEDIRGDDVRELRFQQVFRGYKVGEVDWALARLAARVDELERKLASAHGESPQSAVERTGSGVVPTHPTPPQTTAGPVHAHVSSPWTTGTLTASAPAQHQHAAPAQPVAASPAADPRTVRTERHDTPENARTVRTDRHETRDERATVRTERHGGNGTPAPQRDAGSPDAAVSNPQSTASSADKPQPRLGPIPWSGVTATGPWEAPPSPDGTGTYTPVPEVSRAESAERPSSLSLPPVTTTSGISPFTQPPTPPPGTAQRPDTAEQGQS
ncbi:DivIVA domain-containing protein [Nocardia alni]|uniref:DivIVA domain-containing protein n=1 Tax=Nocardia alni TaxID=2815723 RepID=UPI003F684E83